MVNGIVNNMLLFRRNILQRIKRIDTGQMRMVAMADVQVLPFPDGNMFIPRFAGESIFRNALFNLQRNRQSPFLFFEHCLIIFQAGLDKQASIFRPFPAPA
jgi:hypothetical protein